MRTITKDEFDIILEKHKNYLLGVDGGERANLMGADLMGADLRDANLSGAELSHADLIDADLYGADLYGANLYGANLMGADLHGADLYGANLHGANLMGANLMGADLYGANLSGANLSGTYLDKKEQYRKGVILKKPMRGYKKLSGGSICVLSIPKGAIVFCINGSKCRTNKAKVLSGGGASIFDKGFIYKKGKSYEIEDFDLAYNEECSTGIHFFKTRKEAAEYVD